MRLVSTCLACVSILAPACGDDEDPSATGDSEASSAPGDDDDDDGDSSGGAGQLGPTAQVRIVNLVEGVTFTAWGADTDFHPVIVHEGMTPETVSDYFDAPLNEFTMDPQIVLLPAGEVPSDDATWQVDNSTGPDRAFVIVSELDAADEHATLVVTLDELTGNIQWEQLDETELMLGDASMANLHISWNLFDLAAPVVPAFAVVGDPCLFDGSTGVAQPWSVAPGTFDVGIYDRQTVSECTEELATTSLTVAAGEQALLAVYHVGAEVRFLSAPIAQ